MPSIKNIDKFAEVLNSLGDEPRILQERGQRIESPVVPDKTQDLDNPFLVDIENNENDDMPDLSADLEAFDSDLDLNFDDIDSGEDFDGIPDLDIDDDFDENLVTGDDDLDTSPNLDDFGSTEDLDSIEDVDTLDDDLDTSPNLDDFGSTEDLDSIEDVDTLDDDLDTSLNLDSFDNNEDLDSTEGIDSIDDDFDSSLNLDDFGSTQDFDSIEDVDSLDDDLDTSLNLDNFDNTEDLDSIEDVDTLDDDLDTSLNLDSFDNTQDLDSIEDVDNLDDDLDTSLNLDSFDNTEDLDPIEDLDSLDDDLDTSLNLDDFGSTEDLDSIEDINSLDDDLDTSLNLDDFGSTQDLDSIEYVDSLDDESDTVSDLDSFEDLEEIEDLDDIEEFDDLEELSDISDEDLDTSPDTLDDDLGIQDIDIEDIEEIDDVNEIDELPDDTGFGSLSIEDEVLEEEFGSLDDDEEDEFSLGDFGDSFNFDKEDTSSSLVLEEFEDKEEEEILQKEEITYTKEEFEQIKNTLRNLPLNLRMVIEEEVAENGLFGPKLEELVTLLIDDAPIKDIVKFVNKKLGHNVKVSPAFVKLTALDFEKQKQKFSYILINVVFPKLKWIFPITILGSLLFLAGYFFVYKVVKSENIYKNGYELILQDRYEEAFDSFMDSFNVHRKSKWYHIYADTYLERKAYNYAEKIYLQIINENSSDLGAILKYSWMKAFEEGEFEKAANFLLDYVNHGYRDYELMVTLGDIYMKWATYNSKYYEEARLWYAETMNKYGPKPDILFKYLNYFIETDNLQEVKNYRRMFEISSDIKVDGDIYAKMAGYLMDKGIVDNVRETLFRGLNDNSRNPNLHYQLARYFASIDNYREVEKAARNAIFYYEYGGELTKEELSSLVDTKRILGDLYSKDEMYLAAEKNYKEASTIYENLLERNFVEKDEKFGKIYAGYGDIFYYAGNSYNSAKNLYTLAEENSYSTPELSYKKGFINYQNNDMESALVSFHASENIKENREQVMFAKANTLAFRGSYSSALTYYNMHLRYLQKIEEENETLYPADNQSHLALLENYIRLYNNIGVNLYKLKGDTALPEVGMAFTKSTEYYDYLTRDPELLIRSGLKDLAYYNTKAVLYPTKNMELLMYNAIPKDFKDLNLGIVASVQQNKN